MGIRVREFSGIAPALTPWKLPLGMAQVAQNINPDSRTIKPWKDAIVAASGYSAASITTIFRFGRGLTSDTQYWFQWALDIDVLKGPVIADTTERTFWTGDGAPKWTNSTMALTGGLQAAYPKAWRDLGVPAPVTAPVLSVGGTPSSNDYQVQAYAYTNVSAYGEESAPSLICAGQKVYSGQSATLTGFDAAPSTATNATTARRLYRAVTSSADTQLYFVKEFGSSATSCVDDVGSNIGESIKTTGWAVPPATLFGLTAMANGILVGCDGYDVCVSAQYAPYAWPARYKLSADFPIVGGRAIGTQVAVLTKGNPYMLSGTTPDSLTLTKLSSPEACLSKRSIVCLSSPMPSMSGTDIMVDTVYYASQNGLCAMDSGGAVRNVFGPSPGGLGLMNREDWQALNPTSIQGYAYNGKYFGFYNTGIVTGGFCYDPKGGQASLTLFPFNASAGFYDIVQDHLLLQVGTNIVLWNSAGTSLTATWRSGVIGTGWKTWAFGLVMARSYSGTITFKLYGDGFLQDTVTVTDAIPFKLSGNDKCQQWEIEITTTADEVYEIGLYSSVDDLLQTGAQ